MRHVHVAIDVDGGSGIFARGLDVQPTQDCRELFAQGVIHGQITPNAADAGILNFGALKMTMEATDFRQFQPLPTDSRKLEAVGVGFRANGLAAEWESAGRSVA